MSIKHQQPLTLLKTLRVQRKVSSSFAFGILLLKCSYRCTGGLGQWALGKSSCGISMEQPGLSVEHLTEGINFSFDGEVFYFLST